MYRRDDWTDFRDLTDLSRRAGVPLGHLGRLVAKELADNALDEAGECEIGRLDDGGFYVANPGNGLPKDPEAIADLFSIRRERRTSKTSAGPTRGCLGHGLRVVVGAVLASEGSLRLRSGGRVWSVQPQDNGSTKVRPLGSSDDPDTRIDVTLGPAVPADPDVLVWAERAQWLAAGQSRYRGRASPWWFTSDSFYEFLQSAGDQTVRDVISTLEGCSGPKAGRIVATLQRRAAGSLARTQAERLLERARSESAPVSARRLGHVGKIRSLPSAYKRADGIVRYGSGRGSVDAEVPFVVEAWAECGADSDALVFVNRSPVVGEIHGFSKDRTFFLFGCGLRIAVPIGRKECALFVNVECPKVQLTSDGKEPDLSPFAAEVELAVQKAVKSARRRPTASASTAFDEITAALFGFTAPTSMKGAVLAALPRAVEEAGDGPGGRFTLRRLFYVLRTMVLADIRKEAKYDYFADIVTEYESNTGGDIPGICRDARGLIYHPHLRQEIPIGTLSVESYERPAWRFNKILYIEKEGFYQILVQSGWPEANDCAVFTAKGFATRAVRDLIDALGETQEPLIFFCVHDADAAGTLIYEKLQEATKARPARKVQIINLGLEADEALAMGLQVDELEPKKREPTSASYVPDDWKRWYRGEKVGEEWVGGQRVELDAMPVPLFFEWLDGKIAKYGLGKVVPPGNVLRRQLAQDVEDRLRRAISDDILREAGYEAQVAAAVESVAEKIDECEGAMPGRVRRTLQAAPHHSWQTPVAAEADQVVAGWRTVRSHASAPARGGSPPRKT